MPGGQAIQEECHLYVATIQGTIATTGTTQQLTNNPLVIQNLVLTSKTGNNAAGLVVLNSGTASTNSTGTGVGYILLPGASVTVIGALNTNEVWLAGTTGDVYSAIGT